MDGHRRKLERKAATGDYDAWIAYRHAVVRSGERDPAELGEPTEWEDIQDEFDNIFWHAKRGLKCGLWGSNGVNCFWDVDFKTSVFKAHHDWGHKGWGDGNSKRKTLRTHRSTKKKARNYRLPKERKPKPPETEVVLRRMKRFGGRERLYGAETRYEWDPEQERYRRSTVYWCRVPLDE